MTPFPSTPLSAASSVGELVRTVPARARVLEALGIGYCGGAQKTLAEACEARGLDPVRVLARLEAVESDKKAPPVDLDALSLASLCDHLVESHHAYLTAELPWLDRLSRKVAAVHGEQEPRLVELREMFKRLGPDLAHHAEYEEEIVFPQLSALATCETSDALVRGLRGIFAQLLDEHDQAREGLARMRVLTDHYTPPPWACNTFRVLYSSLAQLDRDLSEHIEKEDSVLFPRALAAVGG